jgi:hypothetical protein
MKRMKGPASKEAGFFITCTLSDGRMGRQVGKLYAVPDPEKIRSNSRGCDFSLEMVIPLGYRIAHLGG